MPASAWSKRLRPSNVKGLVTTATVRMPRSFASEATTGAAPVPVPPPSPAVMKTMSAPWRSRVISSGSSWAASRPTSGFEPAPRPCVSLAPSWIFIGAGEARRACMSVLATMNSTPVNSAVIMRLTALPPPPPSPITLIFAACGTSSSSKSGRRVRSVIETSSFADRLRRAPRVRERAPAIIASSANSRGCGARSTTLGVISGPSRNPEERDGSAGAPRTSGGWRPSRGPHVQKISPNHPASRRPMRARSMPSAMSSGGAPTAWRRRP